MSPQKLKFIKNRPMRILVVHGPNLNLLGEREPEIYGTMTLSGLNQKIRTVAKKMNIQIRAFQSNSEGSLIDYLHTHRKWSDAVVINPGAYSHYSYAIRDAIASISKPTVEVHLSDLTKREDFRKVSVIAPVCLQQISGLGWESYTEAIRLLQNKRNSEKELEIIKD